MVARATALADDACLRFEPIFKRGTVVQQRVIMHKLNIAGSQFHFKMQRGVIGKGIEAIQRGCLFGSQRCNVRKASCGFDVTAIDRWPTIGRHAS